MSTEIKTGNKKLHIELLRVLAIVFVFFNHTNEVGYTLFVLKPDSAMRPLYIFLSDICVIAVPLFFMISGALLLGKEESYKDLFVKRILRIVLALIVSSIAYNIYYLVMWDNPFDLWKIISKLPFSWAYFSQWYLYSYLAFLVMLPLLRKLVKTMEVKDYVYVILASVLIVGVIPMTVYTFSLGQLEILSYFEPTMLMTECIIYALLGYFVENVLSVGTKATLQSESRAEESEAQIKDGEPKVEQADSKVKKSNRNVKLALILLSLLALFVTERFVLFKYALLGTLDGNWLSGTQKMLALIPTLTVYYIAKSYFDTHSVKPVIEKIITAAGGSVFGVFLIEGILRESTFNIYGALFGTIGILPACLIWILTAVIIGIVVIWIIKKIPYVSKLI